MIIAVNAVVPACKPSTAGFIQEVFLNIAAAHPEHRFLLIGFTEPKKNIPSNCIAENNGTAIKSPLRFSYWLNYQLPALLKKNKADILVSYNCCSLRLKTPQLLFTDDLSFLKHPGLYSKTWQRFYKKNMPEFLHKAAAVTTSSSFLQQEIKEHYPGLNNKVTVVYTAAAAVFKPAVHWNQQDMVKQKLTGGKEYFLYNGPIYTAGNLVLLLKAFSFFKQRQKSNMQLVLASTFMAEPALLKSLASYKYRTDVVVAENITMDEAAGIMAAAYAAVYPAVYDAAGTGVLQALQCSTPVITSNTGAPPEICGEAAVYCYAGDFNDIAAKMMLLFTNEDRRNQLVAKGRTRVLQFDMATAQQRLWHTVESIPVL